MISTLHHGCWVFTAAILISLGSLMPALGGTNEAVVPQYGKFEASFTLPGQSGNPFDPAVNDVDAVIRGPHGRQDIVPAFWDGDCWRIRYSPVLRGQYKLSGISRNGGGVQPEALSASRFLCEASDNPGFIRTGSDPVQQFHFDNGKTYYPFGLNTAWTVAILPDYETIFGRLRDAHLNWARVWMSYWDGKALDWSIDPKENLQIGSLSLEAAKKWDVIFDTAARDHIYVQMTLQHHGPYTAYVDPNWKDNPFNAANGGFLTNPGDFFTDPRAITLTKAKYRYVVARWGYSPNLMAYELFNEVQNITEMKDRFQDVVQWHKMMADYIRSIDTNHHLITTSNLVPGEPLSKIGLDYDQLHIYTPDPATSFTSLPLDNLATPLFVGEWGPSPMTEERVRNGIWSGLMTPMAGAAQFWYYDTVEQKNWWPLLSSAGAFVEQMHIADLEDFHPLSVQADGAGARGDLTFAPPGGWGSTTTTDVQLGANGEIAGLSGMSSYLQGQGHRDMLPAPIAFHVDAKTPCRFVIQFGTVAQAGAHPTLALDGGAPQEKDLAPAAKNYDTTDDLAIDVPVGRHTVSLFNTGADWVTIGQIQMTGYAAPILVDARGSRLSATFWISPRPGSSPVVRDVRLIFPGLSDGGYGVRLWDVAAAAALPELSARCTSGSLTLTIPTVTGDLAGVIVRRN